MKNMYMNNCKKEYICMYTKEMCFAFLNFHLMLNNTSTYNM